MSAKIILFLLFITIAIITFATCGQKPDGMQTADLENQSTDYRKLSIVIPDNITAKDFVVTDNGVILLANDGIISINYDGEINDVIPHIGNKSFTQLSIDGDGNFNILAMNKNEDGTTHLAVNHFKSDGAKLPRTALKGPFAEEENDPYIVDFLTANGHYYVQSMYGVYIYNGAGELVQTVREEHDTLANSLFLTKDGMVTSVSTRNRDNAALLIVRIFEPDASDFTEQLISITATSPGNHLVSGSELGFLMIETPGLHEYGLETGRGNLFLNLMDHGVNTSEIIGLSLTPDGDIICVMPRGSILMRTAGEVVVFSTKPDHVRGTMEAYWLGGTPIVVDTGPPKEKETITLAVVYFGDFIKTRVNRFNMSNPDYRIEVINYLDGRDEKDAIRQFTIDLVHDPADIIILTSIDVPRSWHTNTSVPIHSYARKGIFTDLYELMDADPDFNRADYLPNVLKALEMDERLYTIFPTFKIRVIMGKASDLEAVAIGWTLDEFISFLDTKPDAKHIINDWTKADFISKMIEYYFTDPETGGMKFDREAFLKILTAAEKFPKASPFEGDDFDDWEDIWFGLKDGNPLMYQTSLGGGEYGFRWEWTFEYLFFGEEITYKGFPSPTGTGSGTYFRPELRLAIAEKSQRKDGAWEFIKFTMNDYIFWSLPTDELPIKISQLNDWLDATLVNLINIVGDEYEYAYYLDFDTDKKIIIGNNTPEFNAKIMEVINATTVIAPSDLVVRDIIAEEVAFYLAGQKTPDQVADIIENRVSIYLSELE